jgi:hypothetical protein
MHRLVLSLAVVLLGTAAATAFDDASQAVIDRSKTGKGVTITDVATLMMASERWCYNQQDTKCQWSDVYLSTTADKAVIEISTAWSETTDISYVSEGEFREGRFICDIAFDWIPSVRAYGRVDGYALEGRELADLRAEISEMVDTSDDHACYDYIYRGHDASAQTITLLQRDYAGTGGDVLGEATVTLHFDKVTAEGLGWYW